MPKKRDRRKNITIYPLEVDGEPSCQLMYSQMEGCLMVWAYGKAKGEMVRLGTLTTSRLLVLARQILRDHGGNDQRSDICCPVPGKIFDKRTNGCEHDCHTVETADAIP